MISQLNVEELIQKTRRYEYLDGLRDLQLAVLFGFSGLCVWLGFQPFWFRLIGNMTKMFGRWAAWLGMLPLVLMLLAVWGMTRLMDYLRSHWLWRKTGMVRARSWVVPRHITLISAGILLGGIAFGFVLRRLGWIANEGILNMLWTATGWSFGYTLVAMGRNLGLRRYLWFGVLGAVLSTAMLFLPLSFALFALAFGLLWFCLLVISGLITWRKAALNVKRGA